MRLRRAFSMYVLSQGVVGVMREDSAPGNKNDEMYADLPPLVEDLQPTFYYADSFFFCRNDNDEVYADFSWPECSDMITHRPWGRFINDTSLMECVNHRNWRHQNPVQECPFHHAFSRRQPIISVEDVVEEVD